MNHAHMAWEFVDLFADLPPDQINEMLAKNVPMETLEFFNAYAESYGTSESMDGDTRRRLPNLLLVGYLLRVLEERLLDDQTLD